MPLLEDVEDFLTASGVIVSPWVFSIGFMPDDVATAIAIYEYPGPPQDTMAGETEQVKLQLVVRGLFMDYAVTRAKWKAIHDLLRNAQQGAGSPALLPGVVMFHPILEGPMPMKDSKGRQEFKSNYNVRRYRD